MGVHRTIDDGFAYFAQLLTDFGDAADSFIRAVNDWLPFPVLPPIVRAAIDGWLGEYPDAHPDDITPVIEMWNQRMTDLSDVQGNLATLTEAVLQGYQGAAPAQFGAASGEFSRVIMSAVENAMQMGMGLVQYQTSLTLAKNSYEVMLVMTVAEIAVSLAAAVPSLGGSLAGIPGSITATGFALRALMRKALAEIGEIVIKQGYKEFTIKGAGMAIRRGWNITLAHAAGRIGARELEQALARIMPQFKNPAIRREIAQQLGNRYGGRAVNEAITRRALDKGLSSEMQRRLAEAVGEHVARGSAGKVIGQRLLGYSVRSGAMYGGGGDLAGQLLTVAETNGRYQLNFTNTASAFIGASLGGGPLAMAAGLPGHVVLGAAGGVIGQVGAVAFTAGMDKLTNMNAPHDTVARGARGGMQAGEDPLSWDNLKKAALGGAVGGGQELYAGGTSSREFKEHFQTNLADRRIMQNFRAGTDFANFIASSPGATPTGVSPPASGHVGGGGTQTATGGHTGSGGTTATRPGGTADSGGRVSGGGPSNGASPGTADSPGGRPGAGDSRRPASPDAGDDHTTPTRGEPDSPAAPEEQRRVAAAGGDTPAGPARPAPDAPHHGGSGQDSTSTRAHDGESTDVPQRDQGSDPGAAGHRTTDNRAHHPEFTPDTLPSASEQGPATATAATARTLDALKEAGYTVEVDRHTGLFTVTSEHQQTAEFRLALDDSLPPGAATVHGDEVRISSTVSSDLHEALQHNQAVLGQVLDHLFARAPIPDGVSPNLVHGHAGAATGGMTPQAEGTLWHALPRTVQAGPDGMPSTPGAGDLADAVTRRQESGPDPSLASPRLATALHGSPGDGPMIAEYGNGNRIVVQVELDDRVPDNHVQADPGTWEVRADGSARQTGEAAIRIGRGDLDALLEAGLRTVADGVPGRDQPHHSVSRRELSRLPQEPVRGSVTTSQATSEHADEVARELDTFLRGLGRTTAPATVLTPSAPSLGDPVPLPRIAAADPLPNRVEFHPGSVRLFYDGVTVDAVTVVDSDLAAGEYEIVFPRFTADGVQAEPLQIRVSGHAAEDDFQRGISERVKFRHAFGEAGTALRGMGDLTDGAVAVYRDPAVAPLAQAVMTAVPGARLVPDPPAPGTGDGGPSRFSVRLPDGTSFARDTQGLVRALAEAGLRPETTELHWDHAETGVVTRWTNPATGEGIVLRLGTPDSVAARALAAQLDPDGPQAGLRAEILRGVLEPRDLDVVELPSAERPNGWDAAGVIDHDRRPALGDLEVPGDVLDRMVRRHGPQAAAPGGIRIAARWFADGADPRPALGDVVSDVVRRPDLARFDEELGGWVLRGERDGLTIAALVTADGTVLEAEPLPGPNTEPGPPAAGWRTPFRAAVDAVEGARLRPVTLANLAGDGPVRYTVDLDDAAVTDSLVREFAARGFEHSAVTGGQITLRHAGSGQTLQVRLRTPEADAATPDLVAGAAAAMPGTTVTQDGPSRYTITVDAADYLAAAESVADELEGRGYSLDEADSAWGRRAAGRLGGRQWHGWHTTWTAPDGRTVEITLTTEAGVRHAEQVADAARRRDQLSRNDPRRFWLESRLRHLTENPPVPRDAGLLPSLRRGLSGTRLARHVAGELDVARVTLRRLGGEAGALPGHLVARTPDGTEVAVVRVHDDLTTLREELANAGPALTITSVTGLPGTAAGIAVAPLSGGSTVAEVVTAFADTARPNGWHHPDVVVDPRRPPAAEIRLEPDRVRHILDGDRGGGHRSGTGRPGKTEFPERWKDDDARTEAIIRQTAENPTRVVWNHEHNSWLATREHDGVVVAVAVLEDGWVATAYPLEGGRGVVVNPVPAPPGRHEVTPTLPAATLGRLGIRHPAHPARVAKFPAEWFEPGRMESILVGVVADGLHPDAVALRPLEPVHRKKQEWVHGDYDGVRLRVSINGDNVIQGAEPLDEPGGGGGPRHEGGRDDGALRGGDRPADEGTARPVPGPAGRGVAELGSSDADRGRVADERAGADPGTAEAGQPGVRAGTRGAADLPGDVRRPGRSGTAAEAGGTGERGPRDAGGSAEPGPGGGDRAGEDAAGDVRATDPGTGSRGAGPVPRTGELAGSDARDGGAAGTAQDPGDTGGTPDALAAAGRDGSVPGGNGADPGALTVTALDADVRRALADFGKAGAQAIADATGTPLSDVEDRFDRLAETAFVLDEAGIAAAFPGDDAARDRLTPYIGATSVYDGESGRVGLRLGESRAAVAAQLAAGVVASLRPAPGVDEPGAAEHHVSPAAPATLAALKDVVDAAVAEAGLRDVARQVATVITGSGVRILVMDRADVTYRAEVVLGDAPFVQPLGRQAGVDRFTVPARVSDDTRTQMIAAQLRALAAEWALERAQPLPPGPRQVQAPEPVPVQPRPAPVVEPRIPVWSRQGEGSDGPMRTLAETVVARMTAHPVHVTARRTGGGEIRLEVSYAGQRPFTVVLREGAEVWPYFQDVRDGVHHRDETFGRRGDDSYEIPLPLAALGDTLPTVAADAVLAITLSRFRALLNTPAATRFSHDPGQAIPAALAERGVARAGLGDSARDVLVTPGPDTGAVTVRATDSGGRPFRVEFRTIRGIDAPRLRSAVGDHRPYVVEVPPGTTRSTQVRMVADGLRGAVGYRHAVLGLGDPPPPRGAITPDSQAGLLPVIPADPALPLHAMDYTALFPQADPLRTAAGGIADRVGDQRAALSRAQQAYLSTLAAIEDDEAYLPWVAQRLGELMGVPSNDTRVLDALVSAYQLTPVEVEARVLEPGQVLQKTSIIEPPPALAREIIGQPAETTLRLVAEHRDRLLVAAENAANRMAEAEQRWTQAREGGLRDLERIRRDAVDDGLPEWAARDATSRALARILDEGRRPAFTPRNYAEDPAKTVGSRGFDVRDLVGSRRGLVRAIREHEPARRAAEKRYQAAAIDLRQARSDLNKRRGWVPGLLRGEGATATGVQTVANALNLPVSYVSASRAAEAGLPFQGNRTEVLRQAASEVRAAQARLDAAIEAYLAAERARDEAHQDYVDALRAAVNAAADDGIKLVEIARRTGLTDTEITEITRRVVASGRAETESRYGLPYVDRYLEARGLLGRLARRFLGTEALVDVDGLIADVEAIDPDSPDALQKLLELGASLDTALAQFTDRLSTRDISDVHHHLLSYALDNQYLGSGNEGAAEAKTRMRELLAWLKNEPRASLAERQLRYRAARGDLGRILYSPIRERALGLAAASGATYYGLIHSLRAGLIDEKNVLELQGKLADVLMLKMYHELPADVRWRADVGLVGTRWDITGAQGYDLTMLMAEFAYLGAEQTDDKEAIKQLLGEEANTTYNPRWINQLKLSVAAAVQVRDDLAEGRLTGTAADEARALIGDPDAVTSPVDRADYLEKLVRGGDTLAYLLRSAGRPEAAASLPAEVPDMFNPHLLSKLRGNRTTGQTFLLHKDNGFATVDLNGLFRAGPPDERGLIPMMALMQHHPEFRDNRIIWAHLGVGNWTHLTPGHIDMLDRMMRLVPGLHYDFSWTPLGQYMRDDPAVFDRFVEFAVTYSDRLIFGSDGISMMPSTQLDRHATEMEPVFRAIIDRHPDGEAIVAKMRGGNYVRVMNEAERDASQRFVDEYFSRHHTAWAEVLSNLPGFVLANFHAKAKALVDHGFVPHPDQAVGPGVGMGDGSDVTSAETPAEVSQRFVDEYYSDHRDAWLATMADAPAEVVRAFHERAQSLWDEGFRPRDGRAAGPAGTRDGIWRENPQIESSIRAYRIVYGDFHRTEAAKQVVRDMRSQIRKNVADRFERFRARKGLQPGDRDRLGLDKPVEALIAAHYALRAAEGLTPEERTELVGRVLDDVAGTEEQRIATEETRQELRAYWRKRGAVGWTTVAAGTAAGATAVVFGAVPVAVAGAATAIAGGAFVVRSLLSNLKVAHAQDIRITTESMMERERVDVEAVHRLMKMTRRLMVNEISPGGKKFRDRFAHIVERVTEQFEQHVRQMLIDYVVTVHFRLPEGVTAQSRRVWANMLFSRLKDYVNRIVGGTADSINRMNPTAGVFGRGSHVLVAGTWLVNAVNQLYQGLVGVGLAAWVSLAYVPSSLLFAVTAVPGIWAQYDPVARPGMRKIQNLLAFPLLTIANAGLTVEYIAGGHWLGAVVATSLTAATAKLSQIGFKIERKEGRVGAKLGPGAMFFAQSALTAIGASMVTADPVVAAATGVFALAGPGIYLARGAWARLRAVPGFAAPRHSRYEGISPERAQRTEIEAGGFDDGTRFEWGRVRGGLDAVTRLAQRPGPAAPAERAAIATRVRENLRDGDAEKLAAHRNTPRDPGTGPGSRRDVARGHTRPSRTLHRGEGPAPSGHTAPGAEREASPERRTSPIGRPWTMAQAADPTAGFHEAVSAWMRGRGGTEDADGVWSIRDGDANAFRMRVSVVPGAEEPRLVHPDGGGVAEAQLPGMPAEKSHRTVMVGSALTRALGLLPDVAHPVPPASAGTGDLVPRPLGEAGEPGVARGETARRLARIESEMRELYVHPADRDLENLALRRRWAETVIALAGSRPAVMGFYHRNVPVETGFGRVNVRVAVDGATYVDLRIWPEADLLARMRPVLPGMAALLPGVAQTWQSVGANQVQPFEAGRTLTPAEPVPDQVIEDVVDLFAGASQVRAAELPALPEGWPATGDTASFAGRLSELTEAVHARARHEHGDLLAAFGVPDDPLRSVRASWTELTRRPFGLVHMDLHRGNILVRDEDGAAATFLDWELSLYGDPVAEMARHLHLMYYTAEEEARLLRRWAEVMPAEAIAGWEDDLPRHRSHFQIKSAIDDSVRAAEAFADPATPAARKAEVVADLTAKLNRAHELWGTGRTFTVREVRLAVEEHVSGTPAVEHTSTAGAELPTGPLEPTAGTARWVAARAGLDVAHTRITVVTDPEVLALMREEGALGMTPTHAADEIWLAPEAFATVETLARVLGHELAHVGQLRLGIRPTANLVPSLERNAEAHGAAAVDRLHGRRARPPVAEPGRLPAPVGEVVPYLFHGEGHADDDVPGDEGGRPDSVSGDPGDGTGARRGGRTGHDPDRLGNFGRLGGAVGGVPVAAGPARGLDRPAAGADGGAGTGRGRDVAQRRVADQREAFLALETVRKVLPGFDVVPGVRGGVEAFLGPAPVTLEITGAPPLDSPVTGTPGRRRIVLRLPSGTPRDRAVRLLADQLGRARHLIEQADAPRRLFRSRHAATTAVDAPLAGRLLMLDALARHEAEAVGAEGYGARTADLGREAREIAATLPEGRDFGAIAAHLDPLTQSMLAGHGVGLAARSPHEAHVAIARAVLGPPRGTADLEQAMRLLAGPRDDTTGGPDDTDAAMVLHDYWAGAGIDVATAGRHPDPARIEDRGGRFQRLIDVRGLPVSERAELIDAAHQTVANALARTEGRAFAYVLLHREGQPPQVTAVTARDGQSIVYLDPARARSGASPWYGHQDGVVAVDVIVHAPGGPVPIRGLPLSPAGGRPPTRPYYDALPQAERDIWLARAVRAGVQLEGVTVSLLDHLDEDALAAAEEEPLRPSGDAASAFAEAAPVQAVVVDRHGLPRTSGGVIDLRAYQPLAARGRVWGGPVFALGADRVAARMEFAWEYRDHPDIAALLDDHEFFYLPDKSGLVLVHRAFGDLVDAVVAPGDPRHPANPLRLVHRPLIPGQDTADRTWTALDRPVFDDMSPRTMAPDQMRSLVAYQVLRALAAARPDLVRDRLVTEMPGGDHLVRLHRRGDTVHLAVPNEFLVPATGTSPRWMLAAEAAIIDQRLTQAGYVGSAEHVAAMLRAVSGIEVTTTGWPGPGRSRAMLENLVPRLADAGVPLLATMPRVRHGVYVPATPVRDPRTGEVRLDIPDLGFRPTIAEFDLLLDVGAALVHGAVPPSGGPGPAGVIPGAGDGLTVNPVAAPLGRAPELAAMPARFAPEMGGAELPGVRRTPSAEQLHREVLGILNGADREQAREFLERYWKKMTATGEVVFPRRATAAHYRGGDLPVVRRLADGTFVVQDGKQPPVSSEALDGSRVAGSRDTLDTERLALADLLAAGRPGIHAYLTEANDALKGIHRPDSRFATPLDKADQAGFNDVQSNYWNNKLGDLAAEHAVHDLQAEYARAGAGPLSRVGVPDRGAHHFDAVYIDGGGNYVIVEAKGPSAGLNVNGGYEQGHPQYVHNILDAMEGRGGEEARVAAEMRAQLNAGALRYLHVRATVSKADLTGWTEDRLRSVPRAERPSDTYSGYVRKEFDLRITTTRPEDRLLRLEDGGSKPRPWPAERRDPRFDYWESGKLKVTPDNIRLVAEKYGIRVHPRARVVINKAKRGMYGETLPDGRGARVEITPSAFVNEEILARTLYHELVHVAQMERAGWRRQETAAEGQAWENEASAADQQWWRNHPLNQERER